MPSSKKPKPLLRLLLSILFLCGLVNGKPMRILRLEANQLQEILQYLHAHQQQVEEVGTKQQREESDKSEVDKPALPVNKHGDVGAAIDLSSPGYLLDDEKKVDASASCQLEAEEQRQIQSRIRHFLHSQFKQLWSNKQQFSVQVLGMEVAIHSIQARHIRVPHVQLQPICTGNGQNGLIVTMSGGSLALRAKYRSVYRTVRTGTVRVRLGHFLARVNDNSTPEGECVVNVRRRDVRLRPRLLEEVDQTVADHLTDRLRHLICSRLPSTMLIPFSSRR